jgi:hypothetical protein
MPENALVSTSADTVLLSNFIGFFPGVLQLLSVDGFLFCDDIGILH